MNGGIILSVLFFLMGLAVMVAFISPINTMLDMAQQSDNLNCKGFIYDGNVMHALSFDNLSDGGDSGSPLACLALKLYLPYILLVFLIGGLSAIIGGRGADLVGFDDGSGGGGNYYGQ
jgi:hypothetical protein